MGHPHRFVVTIDGAAGTGKSTVAQELARRLGTACLDTGAMYRAVALLCVEQKIEPTDGKALALEIQRIGLQFDWEQEPPALLMGGEDISRRIRELDICGVVSIVAKQPEVREVLVQQQRLIGNAHPLLVTEGRDQGSVVFPDAAIRFFLTAAVDERTKRRVKQLRDAGTSVDDSVVQQDIESRDQIDSTRTDGPLTCPDGAIIIDTSSMSKTEVVDAMESEVNMFLRR